MTQDTFSSAQKESIRRLLRKIEPEREAVSVGHAIHEVSLMFNMHPLVVMEQILREMGSETYLIAVPFDGEVSERFEAKMPHSGERTYSYYLHPCVDGILDAREMMQAVETTPARNMLDLANTGLLTSRKRG